MNASRARRRLTRWQRYEHRYPGCGPRNWTNHKGYMKAHWDYLNANRYPPKGIRPRVWVVGTVAERRAWLKGIGA